MTIEIIKHSDCYIIKHQEIILDASAFADAYTELEDAVIRQKKEKVICDMTSIRNCTFSSIDFDEMKGALFRIFLNAPNNFRLAVAVSNEHLEDEIKKCHTKISQPGCPSNSFVVTSLGDAVTVLNSVH